MNIFQILNLVCGLSLFLFGMNFMGDTLKKSAGKKLKGLLGRLTGKPSRGFLLGLSVTAVIQSSSATMVMVVGFVNSGSITLHQAISVIMGANVGTSLTSWLTGLAGLESAGGVGSFLEWLKPDAWIPLLAFAGILLYMFGKKERRKSIGMILLGVSVLMVGLNMMSEAVKPLASNESFKTFLLKFQNPFFGVLAGMVMTAVLQSSSAAVGILQSLTLTGAITYGNAIPIILGQNIGTCVTALISSIGAGKNAKRAAFVHFYFNVIGTVAGLCGFYLLHWIFRFSFVTSPLNMWGIAIVHTLFNLLTVALVAPFSGFLERLVCLTVRSKEETEEFSMLDSRLMETPALAVMAANRAAVQMSHASRAAYLGAVPLLEKFNEDGFEYVKAREEKADRFEDSIGAYLVKLSSLNTAGRDSREITKLLRLIGDFERISDHARDLGEAALELHEKEIVLSGQAREELQVITDAVSEALMLAVNSFEEGDLAKAELVEPLKQVVHELQFKVKNAHTLRLQSGECTMEHGFIFSDILNDLERIVDHCSNIAGCVIEISRYRSLELHRYTGTVRQNNADFGRHYQMYVQKYRV